MSVKYVTTVHVFTSRGVCIVNRDQLMCVQAERPEALSRATIREMFFMMKTDLSAHNLAYTLQ